MKSVNKTTKKRSSKRSSASTYKNVKQTNSKRDKWYAVNYLSILIFQSFEDFLTAHELDETGDYVWICNYIQWVNSPILEEKWSVLKSNFANTTITLGDLLFNNVRNIKINDYNDIKQVADKIINSNEYKSLISMRQ
jgi:hypothetical protein